MNVTYFTEHKTSPQRKKKIHSFFFNSEIIYNLINFRLTNFIYYFCLKQFRLLTKKIKFYKSKKHYFGHSNLTNKSLNEILTKQGYVNDDQIKSKIVRVCEKNVSFKIINIIDTN